MADGAWPSMLDGDHLEPLDAMVRASTPISGARRYRTTTRLVVEVVGDSVEAPVADEVVLTRFSTGATHRFENRGTPVVLQPSRPTAL